MKKNWNPNATAPAELLANSQHQFHLCQWAMLEVSQKWVAPLSPAQLADLWVKQTNKQPMVLN